MVEVYSTVDGLPPGSADFVVLGCYTNCDFENLAQSQIPPREPVAPYLKGITRKTEEVKFARPRLSITLGCLSLILAGWILVRVINGLKSLADLDSVIVTMRGLVFAETKFAQTHPGRGYTCTLSSLPNDDMIGEVIEKGRKDEYVFEISGCSVKQVERPNAKYRITARPLLEGSPAFCSDQSGVLKYDIGGSIQKCAEKGVPWTW